MRGYKATPPHISCRQFKKGKKISDTDIFSLDLFRAYSFATGIT
jgi:hypothetical protein